MSALSIRQLTPPLQKRAEAELNEEPTRTASDIQALRQWLAKQPHLSAVKPSDQWLVGFLRGCKFSLERTKEKLDMYYTLRSIVPELYTNRDPMDDKIQKLLSLGVYIPVKKVQSPDAPRVCIMRLGVFDPSKYHLADCLKVAFMITEILLMEDDNLVVSGEEMILDLQGVSMSLIGQFTPALGKKAVTCLEKGMPIRQKGNHMLNTPPGFETVYAMFRTFLSDKLKQRIQVHNTDYAAMHKQITKEILPDTYGGTEGTIKELTEYWKTKVESYRDWFLSEEKQKSDEKSRPGKQKTTQELFGVEGSFRQMEFD